MLEKNVVLCPKCKQNTWQDSVESGIVNAIMFPDLSEINLCVYCRRCNKVFNVCYEEPTILEMTKVQYAIWKQTQQPEVAKVETKKKKEEVEKPALF